MPDSKPRFVSQLFRPFGLQMFRVRFREIVRPISYHYRLFRNVATERSPGWDQSPMLQCITTTPTTTRHRKVLVHGHPPRSAVSIPQLSFLSDPRNAPPRTELPVTLSHPAHPSDASDRTQPKVIRPATHDLYGLSYRCHPHATLGHTPSSSHLFVR